MKIRRDFVTNSSSSSFLLAFKDREDGIKQITNVGDYAYCSKHILRLLQDFLRKKPILSDEELVEKIWDDMESRAFCDLAYNEKDKNGMTYEDRWMREHPEVSFIDFWDAPEVQEELKKRAKAYADDVLKEVKDNPYRVIVEYEDNFPTGSALEHEILPNCNFTAAIFSHH